MGLSSKKSIKATDAKKFQPIIQGMIIEISRVLDIPIQEGSIVSLSQNLVADNNDPYGIFKDITGFLMGIAETVLIKTGNPIYMAIGTAVKIFRHIIFSLDDEAPSISNMLEIIGNNFLDTVVNLKKDNKEMNLENFIQVYADNLQLSE